MKKPTPIRSLCRSLLASVGLRTKPHLQPRRFGQGMFSGARASLPLLALAALAISTRSLAQTPTFNALVQTPVTVGSGFPDDATVGDINGDGKLDAIIPGINGLRVLLGNGNGTFVDQVSAMADVTPGNVVNLNPNLTSYLPRPVGGIGGIGGGIKTVDVNRDGKLDLVCVTSVGINFVNYSFVSVLINSGVNDANGVPLFTTTHHWMPFLGVRPVTVGDLNGDNWPDFIVGTCCNGIQVWTSNGGSGTFTPGQVFSLTPGAGGPSVGQGVITDLNGDGKADYVVSSGQNGGANVFFGKGNGTLQTPGTYLPNGAASVAVADVNGDGRPDLLMGNAAAGSEGLYVYLNSGGGVFSAPSLFAISGFGSGFSGGCSVVVADINGDGKLDAVLSNTNSNSIAILLGDGNGGFGAPGTYPASVFPTFVFVGDFNGDGKPDIGVDLRNSRAFGVLLNTTVAPLPTQTLTILGGVGNPGDIAANTEYYNPATGLWQPAYLVNYAPYGHPVTHPWGNVAGTTRWINYRTDGASEPGAGPTTANTLWYLYRVRFTVPSDKKNPKMTFSLKADNFAQVAINDVSTGSTIEGQADQLNADAVFSQNARTGENTITINVGDFGGLNGFNFRIDLSVQSSQPLTIIPAAPPKTTPVITWANPAPIAFGTALGGAQLNATASVAGNFAYTPAAGTVLNAGTHTLTVAFTPSETTLYNNASGQVTLNVQKATATVTLGNLSQTYDGAPKTASADTAPASLNVTFAYNGSATPPSAAGTYTVVATVNDSNYTGSASGTLTIAKAPATVTLGNLSQTSDGAPKPASVTTVPSNLNVTFTYDGSAAAPSAAGSYAVVATVNSPDYVGSASGTLTITATSASPPVIIGADGSWGGSGPLNLNGGTLQASSSATVTKPIVLGSAGANIDTLVHTLNMQGVISGPGGLTKQGSGTLALLADNTHSGGTRIDGGTVSIFRNANLGAATSLVKLNKAQLRIKTSTPKTRQTVQLNRKIQVSAKGGKLTTFGGRSTTKITKSIRGSGTVRKSGKGTLRLSGNQKYTGKTSVKKGTLVVNKPSKISKSKVTVQKKAKLRGTGQVKKATIKKGAKLAPGNSPGSMSIVEAVDWEPGSIYEWEINDATGAKGTFNGGWDWLDIGGSLNISSTATDPVILDIRSLLVQAGAVEDVDEVLEEEPADPEADLLEAEQAIDNPDEDEGEEPEDPDEEDDDEAVPYGQILNFNPRQNYRWVIATAQGGINGFSTDKFQLNLAEFQNELEGGSFSVEADANNLYLVFTRLNHAPLAQVKDMVVRADRDCSANASIDNGSYDIDDGDTITVTQTPPGPYPVGVTQVTLTVTDNHGASSSRTATVNVIDDTPPTLRVPAAMVVSNDPGNCGAVVKFTVTAADNCSVTVVSTPASGSTFPKGTTTVTSVATDASGNSTTATFTVTVKDTEAPKIATPASNKTVECDGTGNTVALSAWLASHGGAVAIDNCDSAVTWSHNFTALSAGCGATGSATVTFTATDSSGNSSSTTATFAIVDTTGPTLTSNVRDIVPGDAPVTFTVSGQDLCCGGVTISLSARAYFINGSGKEVNKTDACRITINGTQVSVGDSGGVGTVIEITATGTDDCGNKTTTKFVAHVPNPGKKK